LIDVDRIEEAMSTILDAIGDDAAREGLKDTPSRVAEMYSQFFSGLGHDPATSLEADLNEDHKEMVVLKGVRFFSICEHHFLPFYGTADIGYVPNGRVVGFSRLARALDILARRPQLQERLTRQLADTIQSTVRPSGVVVVLRAEHLCISLRGAQKLDSMVVTVASSGILKTQKARMDEFNSLLEKT
jgi:GTP cyclohydrolase I